MEAAVGEARGLGFPSHRRTTRPLAPHAGGFGWRRPSPGTTTPPSSSAPFSPFAKKLDCAGSAGSPTPKKAPRKVPKTPHKVLDAPSLQDDFYLNLVDWSSQNMLAVGLGTCVYL
ncbi:unnamed protein product [Triticum turgidum subsp. durum]|uniref:Uncharacterized protein n=1 Tax=Triticum turgidum subsp. durum TaxID=4567 RepID=A0A9R1QCA3_TRITD|nr:unnamed protein product [Triticum turgidum subsp. durum]